MSIPQIKFGFFLAFKQSVYPFSGLFLHCLAFHWNFHLATLSHTCFISSFAVSVLSACINGFVEIANIAIAASSPCVKRSHKPCITLLSYFVFTFFWWIKMFTVLHIDVVCHAVVNTITSSAWAESNCNCYRKVCFVIKTSWLHCYLGHSMSTVPANQPTILDFPSI